MLTLKNIRKTYGTRRILDRVSFGLGEGQKVALVGPNGVGKSTLLKIAAGLETFEKGGRSVPNRCLLGYLSQEVGALPEERLLQYLRRMAGLEELEKIMKGLEKKISQPAVLSRYEHAQEEYRRLGGYDFERRAKSVLEGLGLISVGLERSLSELSGGEKRKAALAGVLLRGVDVLLLDEPTNNLDLPALLWLEQYLRRSKATCLIASHDRRFLDHVVKKVIEIDWFKRSVNVYGGGWSEYAEVKAHAWRRHKEQYRMQEEERKRLSQSIAEKKAWVERVKEKEAPDKDKFTSNYKKERATRKFNASAKALEGREKRLDTIERPLERSPLIMMLENSKKDESDITLKNLYFGYSAQRKRGMFRGGPLSLRIPFGTRLALLGNNGVGKTTLLKTLTGELVPLRGKVVLGEQVRFGYLMQEHEQLHGADTVRQFLKKRVLDVTGEAMAKALSEFQFAPDALDEKIKNFSPGERVRLILALLSLQQATVLVLDEPTNHLDLEAIEALEEALSTYAGTFLLVTHDRLFLERLQPTCYLLADGTLSAVPEYAAYEQSVLPQVKRILKRLEERHGA